MQRKACNIDGAISSLQKAQEDKAKMNSFIQREPARWFPEKKKKRKRIHVKNI